MSTPGFTDDGVVMGDGYAFAYSTTRYEDGSGVVRFWSYRPDPLFRMTDRPIASKAYGADSSPAEVVGAYERELWEVVG